MAMLATNARANRVRYRAEIGKELSLPLKLQRRMTVSSLTAKGGMVTIKGRVVRPLTTPRSEVRVVRRVSSMRSGNTPPSHSAPPRNSPNGSRSSVVVNAT